MNVWKFLLLLPALSACGCVLVVNPDEATDSEWGSAWERDGRHYEERAYAPQTSAPGVAERVARRYGEDEMLRDSDIHVTARAGTVSLHGRVPDREHFDRAVELALATEGVTEVESRLTVQIDKP